MLSSFQTKMDIVNGILDAVFNNLPGADTADPSTGGTQVDVDQVLSTLASSENTNHNDFRHIL